MNHFLTIYIFIFSFIYQDTFCQSYLFPKTFRSSQVDTIWGKPISDPYRWLERIDSKETSDWIKSQEKFTNQCAGKNLFSLKNYLALYSQINYKPIFRKGKYYFSYQIEDANETPSLYYQKNEDKEPKFLFNPNHIDKSVSIRIDDISVSDDNNIIALVLSQGGSDWKTIRFLDMKTKKLLDDTINFVKHADVYWFKQGVFYVRYDVKNMKESFSGNIKGRQLFYHQIGTSPQADILVYKPQSDYDFFSFEVIPGSRYLAIHNRGIISPDKFFYKVSLIELNDSSAFSMKDFIMIYKKDVYFNIIGLLNGKIIVQSNFNAPNGALYKFDPALINAGSLFVKSYYSDQLLFSKIMDNKVICAYNNDSVSFAVTRDSLGKILNYFEIPRGYKFGYFSAAANDSILVYSFNSFFSPPSVYKLNINAFKQEPLSVTYVRFSNRGLITKKIYYYSKDSTAVPMYLTYKKGIKLDGNNPTLLYGYGGFGISMQPFFDPANIIFLNNGGILATPGIRGGGEFPGWHEMGMRLNKQKSFDDFISAAEYLISEKYTNSNKLVAMGGSNGGLLVGAVMLQRPDLFKAIVSESGVFDMLRYQLYDLGYVNKTEYGNISDSLDFVNIIKYSPVQNVKKDINYPATLLVASENDDRVSPFHSFKFLAQLQSNASGTIPYLLYFEKNAGHSGSGILQKRIETKAYIYSFIFKSLNMEWQVRYDE